MPPHTATEQPRELTVAQEWIDKAVALRADMLVSEVRFFTFLLEGEDGACPWRGKYASFEQLLEDKNLCAPRRYTAYRNTVRKFNGDVLQHIEALGVDGVILAGPMPDEARARYIRRVAQGAKDQGCPLSVRRIKQIAHEEHPTRKPTRHPTPDSNLNKVIKALRLENARLVKENERVNKENAKLKKENEDYRKTVAKLRK